MVSSISLFVFVIGAFLSLPIKGNANWRGLTESVPCGKIIRTQLEGWRAGDKIFEIVDGVDGSQIFHIPTKQLGTWTTLQLSTDVGARVYRMKQHGIDLVTFDNDCGTTKVYQPSTYPSDAFTDDDLGVLLQEKKVLVVYYWSPDISISVQGYKEIKNASTRLELEVVGVVDTGADRNSVARAAEVAGIPLKDRQPIGSVELQRRSLSVKAPSILVFASDWVAPVLRGYYDSHDYEGYLKDLLRSGED